MIPEKPFDGRMSGPMSVELLGQAAAVEWQQTPDALVIQSAGVSITGDVAAFRISVGR